jgi:hypothetical protein
LKWEVAKVGAKKTTVHKPASFKTPYRRSSKQEKIIFEQKNRALVTFTQNLLPETHYLDLDPVERALIDQLFNQHQALVEDSALRKKLSERMRNEYRKRERRLLHKGERQLVLEEQKRNFDEENRELADVAREFHGRHYLELSREEQVSIKDLAADLPRSEVLDELELAEMEDHFRSLQEQAPDGRSGANQTPKRGNGLLRTVSLEAGYPTVEGARKRLSDHLKSASETGVVVLKLIHGYGSSGNGGAIREGIRLSLRRRVKEDLVRLVVFGENWSIFSEDSRRLLNACAEASADSDLDKSNPGVTFVLV